MKSRSLPICHPLGPVLGWLMFTVAIVPCCAEADRLVLLDGSSLSAKIETIGDGGEIALAARREPIRLDGLRRIERGADPDAIPAAARVIVDLLGGGRILGDDVSIADEKCTIKTARHGDFTVSLDTLIAIRLQPKEIDDELSKAIEADRRDTDRLYVRVDDNREAIEGLVERLDEVEVVLQLEGQRRSIARSKIVAIAVASAGALDKSQNCFVRLHQGSAFWSRLVKLETGQLELQIAGGAETVVPWASVAHIDVRSPRLAYLSDLEPTRAEHQAIVTADRPWQRDKNVNGQPLKIGTQTYQKGIGVASRSLLVFDLGGQYARMCVTIGIDADTQGRGNCVFVVRGDGRELDRQKVTGDQPPRDVKIDVRDVEQLELIVEAGEDLDLADHANWCEACLIRN